MNIHVTKLFCVCLDNRVVVIESNFKEFYRVFKNIEPFARSDRWYSGRFKELGEFSQVVGDKEYWFQRLI